MAHAFSDGEEKDMSRATEDIGGCRNPCGNQRTARETNNSESLVQRSSRIKARKVNRLVDLILHSIMHYSKIT